MKNRINHSKSAKSTTALCVLWGHYDDDGQYCEQYFENVMPSELPEYVIDGMSPSYDVSIMIFPQKCFFAFASQMFLNQPKFTESGVMKWLFDSYADYIVPDGQILWSAGNFLK